jgi:hypothetical protein
MKWFKNVVQQVEHCVLDLLTRQRRQIALHALPLSVSQVSRVPRAHTHERRLLRHGAPFQNTFYAPVLNEELIKRSDMPWLTTSRRD